jgi:hypothetical protein
MQLRQRIGLALYCFDGKSARQVCLRPAMYIKEVAELG